MPLLKCKNCGKEVFNHSQGLCITCYKKLLWKPKKTICKICGKERFHHAKGMCKNCANKELYYHHIKKHNFRKWHNIDLETYKKITQRCAVCSFDKIVDLHHLDKNYKNSSGSNFIGLCPNHHKMIHMFDFKEEIIKKLKENGLEVKPLEENESRASE